MNLYYIFINIIFLNLLINDGNNEISIALLNLLKEKKNFTIIYNFIKHNLTYYLQLKLKKLVIILLKMN